MADNLPFEFSQRKIEIYRALVPNPNEDQRQAIHALEESDRELEDYLANMPSGGGSSTVIEVSNQSQGFNISSGVTMHRGFDNPFTYASKDDGVQQEYQLLQVWITGRIWNTGGNAIDVHMRLQNSATAIGVTSTVDIIQKFPSDHSESAFAASRGLFLPTPGQDLIFTVKNNGADDVSMIVSLDFTPIDGRNPGIDF